MFVTHNNDGALPDSRQRTLSSVTSPTDQEPSAPVHLLQESLEAAEDASKKLISTEEALQSKLSQAIAAEDGFRIRCHHLEAQATSTAGQLQELQQQVYRHVTHHRAQLAARSQGVQTHIALHTWCTNAAVPHLPSQCGGLSSCMAACCNASLAMCRWPGQTSSTSRRTSTAPSCRSSTAGCRATRSPPQSASRPCRRVPDHLPMLDAHCTFNEHQHACAVPQSSALLRLAPQQKAALGASQQRSCS